MDTEHKLYLVGAIFIITGALSFGGSSASGVILIAFGMILIHAGASKRPKKEEKEEKEENTDA